MIDNKSTSQWIENSVRDTLDKLGTGVAQVVLGVFALFDEEAQAFLATAEKANRELHSD